MELNKAGVSIEIARKYGLRIDSRRKTVHQENVEKLKKWFSKFSKKKEETQKSKKAREKSQ